MFWWRDRLEEPGAPRVDRAFTDNAGGVSRGVVAGLNLGGRVGDRPEHVEENRRRLARAMDLDPGRLVLMDQVHGARVEVVDRPDGPLEPCDGIVTTTPGLGLVVLVADCTPVLLADPRAGVIAAVHAGRPGMMGGVIDAAVDAMVAVGATRLVAAVGPSVCGRCYEVPDDLRAQARAMSRAAHTVTWQGTPAIDVAAGVVEQLQARQVEVDWVPGCTKEDDRLYSYRQDHGTGRQAGVITLREPAT